MLQGTVEVFSRQVMASQAEMMADVKEIKGYLATFCGLAASALQAGDAGQHGQLLQVFSH